VFREARLKTGHLHKTPKRAHRARFGAAGARSSNPQQAKNPVMTHQSDIPEEKGINRRRAGLSRRNFVVGSMGLAGSFAAGRAAADTLKAMVWQDEAGETFL
jgi:hypothetical protein